MAALNRMSGTIFSDLGQASAFMELDWVQEFLKQSLGYYPFPATLNVRPDGGCRRCGFGNARKSNWPAYRSAPKNGGYCSARLFRIEIHRTGSVGGAARPRRDFAS